MDSWRFIQFIHSADSISVLYITNITIISCEGSKLRKRLPIRFRNRQTFSTFLAATTFSYRLTKIKNNLICTLFVSLSLSLFLIVDKHHIIALRSKKTILSRDDMKRVRFEMMSSQSLPKRCVIGRVEFLESVTFAESELNVDQC